MARIEFIVPRGSVEQQVQNYMRRLANQGVTHVRTFYNAADYRAEIDQEMGAFIERIGRMRRKHDDTEIENRRDEGYAEMIPDIFTSLAQSISNRRKMFGFSDTLFEFDRIDEFRSLLLDRFIRSVDTNPAKINNGFVKAAMGITTMEMIILRYGIDDGNARPIAETARMTQVGPGKVSIDIEKYFEEIRVETKGKRRYKSPLGHFELRLRADLQNFKRVK